MDPQLTLRSSPARVGHYVVGWAPRWGSKQLVALGFPKKSFNIFEETVEHVALLDHGFVVR